MKRAAIAIALCGLVEIAACGSGFPTLKTACMANTTTACVGVGGCAGAQTCKVDGSGFDVCVCGKSPDAGTTPDASMIVDAGKDQNDGCVRVAPNFLCGLAPQCGCGPQETCDVDYPAKSTGETRCVQSTANGAIGSRCTLTSQCAVGLACWNSTCKPYCAKENTPCGLPKTNTCAQLYDTQNAPIPNATVCGINCRLDDPTTCGGSPNGCIWTGGNDTDCFDLSKYNTFSCSQQSPWCAAGYICLQNNTCAKACEVGKGFCGNLYCTPFGSAFIVQGVEYGVCQ